MQAKPYGYSVIRTNGSHMAATLTGESDTVQIVTVRRHRGLRLGALDDIVTDLTEFAGQSKREIRETLLG